MTHSGKQADIPLPDAEPAGEEERFRLVVESAPNGIIVADESGKIVMVNRRAEEMFGYSRDEFMSLTIEALVPQRFRGGHSHLREGFKHESRPRAMGAGRDLFAVREDETEFPVEIALTPLPREEGGWILSSIIDITQRKAAEAQLNFQSEILQNIHDAVFYVDEEGIVKDWNEGATRIFGVPVEQAIGGKVNEVCGAQGMGVVTQRIQEQVDQHGMAEEVIQCVLKEGSVIFVRAKFTRLAHGDAGGVVVCASDITRESMLEAEIVKASENEQRRIGQDLHDDLCSQLSGIGCLTKVLEQQAESSSPEQAQLAAKVAEMVSQAGSKAREIAKGLVPTVLETQGLAGAVQVLAERNREMFGVDCSVNFVNEEGLLELGQERSIQLYRITQEALNNAVKHSDAEAVIVSFRCSETKIELRVEDDGKGMSPGTVSSGMGMMTMQRRAEIMGADFEVKASPGEGTSVRCVLPLIK